MRKSSSMDPVQGRPGWAGNPGILRPQSVQRGALGMRQRVLLGNHGLTTTSAVGKIIPDGTGGRRRRLKLVLLLPSDRAAAFLRGLI